MDNLESILRDGCIWSDAQIRSRNLQLTRIGYTHLKAKRLQSKLRSHPSLNVGDCAPFYFSVRPPMLHVIHRRDPDLEYSGGQDPIIYLEVDLREAVRWADANNRRWAFTTSNAASEEFEDFADWKETNEINWYAVEHKNGKGRPEIHRGKQAEFLVEKALPWDLVKCVSARLPEIKKQVDDILTAATHQPRVELVPEWYYPVKED